MTINTILKKAYGVKDMTFKKIDYEEDPLGNKKIIIKVKPTKKAMNRCPICGAKCPGYDSKHETKRWRTIDIFNIMTYFESNVNRIECPEHGVITADVPWAYHKSNFTKDFDITVTWLAEALSKSQVAEFMRIDWKTVGRCISRTLNDIEPDRSVRYDGLVNIGIDETSYKKGHKYMTVVVNHDKNEVVWIGEGHSEEVLNQFFDLLSDEQKKSIKVATGDGARWITNSIKKNIPHAIRCLDTFHIIEWANEALNNLRKAIYHEVHKEALEAEKEVKNKKGRPAKDDKVKAKAKKLKEKASAIKTSTYALGKAPEHLTKNQQEQLKYIAATHKKLYRAYQLKEELRLLFKVEDVELAKELLNKWLWRASHSRIPEIYELNKKIRRHKEHLINTLELRMNNARVEATNNKIKLIIRKSYGFRNIQNMMDMVYLVCSNLPINLPNRKKVKEA